MMRVFKRFPDVDIPMISDVIEPRMSQALEELSKEPNPQKPEAVVEYKRILDRKDIDAVVIATTEFWHGLPHIHACQAGKHVYVEKPLSHTVAEGRAMVEAAKKYGIIAMMGTQQRAGENFKKAVEIVRSGRLGNIALVECWNNAFHPGGQSDGAPKRAPGPSDPPRGYHWDLWLGPAPYVPFNPAWIGGYTKWFDYGGGILTNWGVHHFDAILWAMQAESPISVVCAGRKLFSPNWGETPDLMEVTWEFPDFLMHYFYRGFNNYSLVQGRHWDHGMFFFGTNGTLFLDRYGYELWSDAPFGKDRQLIEQAQVEEDAPNGPYQRGFVDAVKERKKSPVDLEVGHKATVCSHLANIAYRIGRKIRWDGSSENIVDDPEAARLLDRPRRKGFELPRI